MIDGERATHFQVMLVKRTGSKIIAQKEADFLFTQGQKDKHQRTHTKLYT